MAFKMKAGKGGPMRKNFPSAFKDKEIDPADVLISNKETETQEGDAATTSNILKADKEYRAVKDTKGKDRLRALSERYNTTFKKDEKGVFRNPDGKSPSELETYFLDPEA